MRKGSLVIYNNSIFEVCEKKGNTVVIFKPESNSPRSTIEAVSTDKVIELKSGDKVNKFDRDGNQLYFYGLSRMEFGGARMLRLGTINDTLKTAGNYTRQSISA